MGKMIEFKRPDGQSVQGYLAEPAQAAGAPGVVVIQEWWGLNAQIKGVAERYAAGRLRRAGARPVPRQEHGRGGRGRAPDDAT